MNVDYGKLEEEIRTRAKELLEKDGVKYVIGYEQGSDGLARPVFIHKAEDVGRLVFNPVCVNNLTRFLVDEMKKKPARGEEPDLRPIGIIVKPCDSKTIVELIKENIVPRERVKIIGVISDDTVNPKKLMKAIEKVPAEKRNSIIWTSDEEGFTLNYEGGSLKVPRDDINADKCKVCVTRRPIIKDHECGQMDDAPPVPDKFEDIQDLLDMSPEERWAYWEEQFEKCVRCYACREACPLCYCMECVFDKTKPYKWNERTVELRENAFYHIIRAMHLAGRCIDCGECERVCPMDIPIRKMNRYLIKRAQERFKVRSGMNAKDKPMFSDYDINDPGEEIW